MGSTPAPRADQMYCKPEITNLSGLSSGPPDSFASIISEMEAGVYLTREEKETSDYEGLISDWAYRIKALLAATQAKEIPNE